MHTFVVDSGGTSRLLKTCWIVDATNTSQRVKKIWVIDSGNVPRLVYTAAVTFTMVAGEQNIDGFHFFGYSSGSPSYGSLSPTTDPEGNTVTAIAWGGAAGATLALDIAIATNPGSDYVFSLAITPGNTVLGSAAGYSYSSGVASWTWGDYVGFTNGDTYTCVLTL